MILVDSGGFTATFYQMSERGISFLLLDWLQEYLLSKIIMTLK